jgi:hypothetical protein
VETGTTSGGTDEQWRGEELHKPVACDKEQKLGRPSAHEEKQELDQPAAHEEEQGLDRPVVRVEDKEARWHAVVEEEHERSAECAKDDEARCVVMQSTRARKEAATTPFRDSI